MVETDWREILSFSQRELKQADKERLCESLSWMEADDIELNFTDLKTLFRLAQDILKYKSEQVNNLMGELEKGSRKGKKKKHKDTNAESSIKSSDSTLDNIHHQEEIIKANKEIIQQLNSEITKLEERKNKIEVTVQKDDESESSRDPLSEMNETVQLENEIFRKNRHIRKLLVDVKLLEEENVNLKEKLIQNKGKLKEATQLIENLTEQLFSINGECAQLKESLGNCEEKKHRLLLEIESLRNKISTQDMGKENIEDNTIRSKIQHLKNSIKSYKSEIERLSIENTQLKENLILASKTSTSPKKVKTFSEQATIIELQDKLIEASTKIEESANLIQSIKNENKRLKSIIDNTKDLPMSENNNESDDGKEKNMISKLKIHLKSLAGTLQATEEIVKIREEELADLTSQLQLLQSEKGINTLIKSLNNKKLQLKIKNEGIKNLVIEINCLNQRINEIELENETLRQKLNIPLEQKVQTHGILKRYQYLERKILQVTKELHENETKLVSAEMENRKKNAKIVKLTKMLYKYGYNPEKYKESFNEITEDSDSENNINDVTPAILNKNNSRKIQDTEIEAIIKENEGLRVGLQEILNFLKDNSTTSSGILSLKCPTLESICHSMDARHAAGWFAPHMRTVMELKEALGGRDALLTALNESRKETFEIMTQLSKEAHKSLELEKRLVEMESYKNEDKIPTNNMELTDYKLWFPEDMPKDVEYSNKDQIQDMILKRNISYENQLKISLNYFQEKFKSLYDKLTALAVSATDNNNKWSIQEENYKAEIEDLKAKLLLNADDDTSIQSPGLLNSPDIIELQRKVTYLESSYKHIRTQNENLKNEYSECYRDTMLMASDYETKIQSLILCNINLSDKLRRSIPEDLFWKQNTALNELNIKYRNSVETYLCNHIEGKNLQKRLDEDKSFILSFFQKELKVNKTHDDNNHQKISEERLETSVYKKQIEHLISELQNKNSQIHVLKTKNEELQFASEKISESLIGSKYDNGKSFLEQEVDNLQKENEIMKKESRHLQTQLDISLIQLNEIKQQKMATDIEINLLRHQILDLQSVTDSKAIIARLSGEILIAHLQSSENFKKIEKLTILLNKEKNLRADAEHMLRTRQKVLDYHMSCNDHRLRNMLEVIQIFKQQYQGSLPLCTIENYLTNLEELDKKTYAANEKLDEIEDLRQSLIIKHTVYSQILEAAKVQCIEDGNKCEHFLKNVVMSNLQTKELHLCNKKIETLEKSRKSILDRCNSLERTLILINQEQTSNEYESVPSNNDDVNIKIEDIPSDIESSNSSNKTFTIRKTNLSKNTNENDKGTFIDFSKERLQSKNISTDQVPAQKPELRNVNTQTKSINEKPKDSKVSQTDEDQRIVEFNCEISNLNRDLQQEKINLTKIKTEAQILGQEFSIVKEQKQLLEYTIQSLADSHKQKDDFIKSLQTNILGLKNQIDDFKRNQYAQILQEKNTNVEENKHLLKTLKELEVEKNSIIIEYRDLLSKEREEYSKTVKELKEKLLSIQSQLERRGTKADTPEVEVKEAVGKYILKITELQDKCFKLQSDLDGSKSEIMTCQGELDRWKDLANERLSKMEQLSAQLKERHNDEVETYKAENKHWLSQLNETQREHMDLRSRLTEQKALYIKQLADKDAHIEQLRTVVHNLKTQIMNMQTMLSINDPSFDLSAIVEVEEASDAVSPQGSERLELKFESVVDLQEFQDDGPYLKMPTTSTAIWHEPLIERLRREKQLIGKQNAILRRQIKAVAARERRARLDAQNLKNQVFRISTSGNKVTSVESAALQNKIATLQAQLTSARRDANSSVALWDKWKRAQQAAERWQARYEEKCQEEKKLETSLSLSKSALSRLEKEKRVLLSRLSELKSERSSVIEKQDEERSEKGTRSQSDYMCSSPPVPTRALLDRIQAQQRRIAALEVAEKGNEPLVSEYEKALAEITSLKGQVLKLESTLLESQIRTPLASSNDPQPELEYWKSYCDMLKEENMQLTLRVNSLETAPTSAHQQRINDLEQTILTLRGLVSKLQADQKSGVVRRAESRPGSGRSTNEKVRNQIDSYRTEISNLKRTIQEKDLLLERSKEMLKIAAEREEELLKENESLRRQFNELVEHKSEFYSA